MMSLTGPIFLTPLLTYIKPSDYNWELLKHIKKTEDDDKGANHIQVNPLGELPVGKTEEPAVEPSAADAEAEDPLLRARSRALWASLVLTLAYLVLWPVCSSQHTWPLLFAASITSPSRSPCTEVATSSLEASSKAGLSSISSGPSMLRPLLPCSQSGRVVAVLLRSSPSFSMALRDER